MASFEIANTNVTGLPERGVPTFHELVDLVRGVRVMAPLGITFEAHLSDSPNVVSKGPVKFVCSPPPGGDYAFFLSASMDVHPRDDERDNKIPLTMTTQDFLGGPHLDRAAVVRSLYKLGATLLLHEYAEQFKVEGERRFDPHEGPTPKLRVVLDDPLQLQPPERKD